MKGFSSKHIALKVDVIEAANAGKCRHVLSSFSPEISQAGAVKGLNKNLFKTRQGLDRAIKLNYFYTHYVGDFTFESSETASLNPTS